MRACALALRYQPGLPDPPPRCAVAAVPTFIGYQGPERVTAFSGADKVRAAPSWRATLATALAGTAWHAFQQINTLLAIIEASWPHAQAMLKRMALELSGSLAK